MPERDEKNKGKSLSWTMKTGKLPLLAAANLSGNIAKRFGILPVAEEGEVIVLVAREPLSEDAQEELRFVLGNLRYRFAEPSEFLEYRQSFEQLLARLPDFPSMTIGANCDIPLDPPTPKGRTK